MNSRPPGSYVYEIFSSKNTGVCNHSLLQGNLPDPGMEPKSSALQADSSPSEPPEMQRGPKEAPRSHSRAGVWALTMLQAKGKSLHDKLRPKLSSQSWRIFFKWPKDLSGLGNTLLRGKDDAAASSGPRRPAWSSPSFLNPRGFKVGEGLILPQRNRQGPSRPSVPSPADTDPVWRDTGATPGWGGGEKLKSAAPPPRPQSLSLYCALNGDHCYRLTPGRKVILTKKKKHTKISFLLENP